MWIFCVHNVCAAVWALMWECEVVSRVSHSSSWPPAIPIPTPIPIPIASVKHTPACPCKTRTTALTRYFRREIYIHPALLNRKGQHGPACKDERYSISGLSGYDCYYAEKSWMALRCIYVFLSVFVCLDSVNVCRCIKIGEWEGA